jgi:adenosylcobyric acid synthase
LPHLVLDEEDSLGIPGNDQIGDGRWLLTTSNGEGANNKRPLRIAVIAFPSLSNFTDFDSLRAEPSVSLRFCKSALELSGADIVILPGSKQTVDDLLWMRRQQLDTAVCAHASQSLVVGICGGMQMLGQRIIDPDKIEHSEAAEGMGLLPFCTRMNSEKTTRQMSGYLRTANLFEQPVPPISVNGYEIHIGETIYSAEAQAFSVLGDGKLDGCISADTRIFGTYLHGIFDDDSFRHTFITAARAYLDLAPATSFDNWKHKREDSLNRLANAVRQALDIPQILSWVGLAYHPKVDPAILEQSR